MNKIKTTESSFNLFILVLLNFAIFYNYWIGNSTPPWDFLGGGQVEQFRFYKDGGFFNPPSWYPYAWFGIPEYQMVQDGGWFLPVAFVAEFFIWSPPNAARTQAFLILFGSIGAYLLATRVISNKQISLLAGILYTFIPVFFSNAQHYGVVRSAVFLPWILYVLHPLTILKNKYTPIFGILIIFQTIVGSYPGNLISIFYTSFVYIIYHFLSISTGKIKYLISVAFISIPALLMGMIRYLPVITNLNSFPENMGNQAGITLNNLVFTIFPFIGNNLPFSDPTLRSIYIGPLVFAILFFVNLKNKKNIIWFILLALSIIFMMQNQLNNALRNIVPFSNISRFGISDWRNTFNLSLIIITCIALESILKNKIELKKYKYITALLATSYLIYLGIIYKYSVITIVFYSASILIIILIITLNKYKYFTHFLISSTILFSYAFVIDNNFSWSTTVKEQYFNIYRTDYTSIKESIIYPLEKRSRRYFFNEPPLTSDQYKNDQRYNRFWLSGGFGALGYHNIKDVPAYRALFPRLEIKDDPVINFLSLEGKQIGVTAERNVINQLNECVKNFNCKESSQIQFSQRIFDKQLEVFSIKSNSDFIFIQNEMYSLVWKGKICNSEKSCTDIKSIPILDSLRGWNLPKGEYTFETFAETPFNDLRWILFYLGLTISILYSIFNLNQNRSRVINKSRTS